MGEGEKSLSKRPDILRLSDMESSLETPSDVKATRIIKIMLMSISLITE